MSRPFPALAAALVAAALVAAPSGVSAQDMLRGTSAEQEALKAAEAGKYTRARELAETIRGEDPTSFLATWVLAEVFHDWEGNHARALFLLRAAKARLIQAYGAAPTDANAKIWHKRILVKENFLLGEMDEKEAQLGILDEYDRLYAPKLTRLRVWPLMKLGRVDEAREAGKSLLLSSDFNERISAYNGLMALEDELLDRKASYKWGMEGIEHTQGRSCILHHNASQAAMTLFDFAATERLARAALKAERKDCPNSSYEHLANLYLLQGDFQKSISAFKKLSRSPIDRRYRTQFVMGNRAILVDLLYALGKFEEGLEFASQVFEMPDRTGMTSVSQDDIAFAHGVALWRMLDMRIGQLAEERSIRSIFSAAGRSVDARLLRLRRWEVERKLLRLAIKDDILVTNVRPYLRGVKPWFSGDLIRVFGTGLFTAAVKKAQQLDHQVADEARGYYTALYGEIAWVDGDDAEAVALGDAALAAMPKATRLLRWRTLAWLGQARWNTGDRAGALEAWREVLQWYPTALRHLDIRIPVTITADDQPFSQLVADDLEDLRRLEVTGGEGFAIEVVMGDAEVQICLRAEGGFLFNCGRHEVDRADKAEAREAIDAFVATVFSPKVELTSSDINSLDGSTVRVNADRVLDGLLGTPKPKEGEE